MSRMESLSGPDTSTEFPVCSIDPWPFGTTLEFESMARAASARVAVCLCHVQLLHTEGTS